MKKIVKTIFVSTDGKEFNNAPDCLTHEDKNVCPKCNGTGTIMEKYNAYPTNLPDSGWVEKFEFRKIKCDVCNGAGHTKKELKPIVEIVGYE